MILIIYVSCSAKWTTAISYGKVDLIEFLETVDVEVELGLIFVPVQIKGNTYRFLFDSGAPFSISNELQNALDYPVISKGHIVDSDNNRMKVNYVQVDTLRIGRIAFIDQTAFEGDFKSNPILECLEIDGIIGSNLMRHSNWTIDQNQNKITLSNTVSHEAQEESIIVPFQTDYQYNILVNLGIGSSIVKNLTVDYGSNGAIDLPENVFSTLKERKIIDETYLETGIQQSGIIGKPVTINRQIAVIDSVKIEGLKIDDIELRTSSSGLIGNEVLSRFIVTIDWNRKNLYFESNSDKVDEHKTYGCNLGYSSNGIIYVQSVIENSSAFNKGIEPGMQVLKFDSLDFSEIHDYCDYLSMVNASEKIIIEIVDSDGLRREFQIERTSIKN